MESEEARQEQWVQEIYAFAAEQMKNGVKPPKIEALLVDHGLDQESAHAVVANLTQMRNEALREAGKKNMIFGALWFLGGAGVTAFTYSAASGGGTYVVAYGAIAVGLIQFLGGLVQSMKR